MPWPSPTTATAERPCAAGAAALLQSPHAMRVQRWCAPSHRELGTLERHGTAIIPAGGARSPCGRPGCAGSPPLLERSDDGSEASTPRSVSPGRRKQVRWETPGCLGGSSVGQISPPSPGWASLGGDPWLVACEIDLRLASLHLSSGRIPSL